VKWGVGVMSDRGLSSNGGCLAFLFGGGPPSGRGTVRSGQPLPYRRKDYLLTQGERAFYLVLCRAVDADRHRVFCKVRLGDLLWMPKGTDKRQSHWNRIQSKHADFVVCSADVLRPLVVIELDDRSHERSDRRERDRFVDQALAAAGLPVIHVRAQASYNAAQIGAQVAQAMGR
jgi:hypothetical protein